MTMEQYEQARRLFYKIESLQEKLDDLQKFDRPDIEIDLSISSTYYPSRIICNDKQILSVVIEVIKKETADKIERLKKELEAL